jgi:hypothetical protein
MCIDEIPRARLEMHLLGRAAGRIAENEDCSLRPAMTFREQGHRQEDRHRRCGESNADFSIAIGVKAPFQGRADIVERSEVGRAFCPG